VEAIINTGFTQNAQDLIIGDKYHDSNGIDGIFWANVLLK